MEAILPKPNQDVLIEMVDRDEAELRRLIVQAINEHGSVLKAAQSLGVSHAALNYWRKKLNISYVRKAE